MRLIHVGIFVALAIFYNAAASEHARAVNTSKARGDQSGYLWDAQQVYWNWHGRTPPVLVGERNRMPLYAGYLALFYSPEITDDEYFVVAKRWNIGLSLALLAVLAVIFVRHLPPLAAANLTAIVAFGYFVFKAGYAQSELLFYFLFFTVFVGFWQLLESPDGPRRLLMAAGVGVLAALAHLTKAAVLPFLALFVGVYIVAAVCTKRNDVRLKPDTTPDTTPGRAHRRTRPLLADAAVPAIVVAAFLAVLSPYLVNSKQAFGAYFYNVNTTFYVWYDNWAQASVGTRAHGDGVGWPDMPADQIPSAAKYWRSHTVAQIASRIGGGFKDMAARSYRTYGYLKYVVWYLAMLAIVILANTSVFLALVRRNRALAAFIGLYAVSHLVLIAFYEPISGTGTTRFLIAHLTPFFYAASRYLAHPEVARTVRWTIAGIPVGVRHLHVMTALLLGVDLAVWMWPRVMTTYGGF